MEKFIKIVKKYDLSYYLKVLLNKNRANCNTYHNFNHTQTVFVNCYFIAKHEGLLDRTIKPILIAAVFHDFNHSGGKLPDSENIKIAVENFLKYSIEAEEDNKFIIDLIRCTEYPFDPDFDKRLSLEQKIIRDADILQWIETDFMQHVMFGLKQEFEGKTILESGDISRQINFMKSINPFTQYGEIKIQLRMENLIEELLYLKKILTDET